MRFISLRKHEPDPGDEELEEEQPDDTEDEPDEEQPTAAYGPLLTGLLGPGAWIAARAGTGVAWGVHAVAVWAIGFYGGWIAAGIVLVWLGAVLLFVPREALDRIAATIEHRDAGLPADALEGASASAPTDPRTALAEWLLATMGDQPGIHLRELYPAMRNLPGQEGRTDAELRAALQALGVPVRRSVRIGRIAGRSGVYRHDVEALLPSRGDRPVETGGDAGQGGDSPPLSGVGEEV